MPQAIWKDLAVACIIVPGLDAIHLVSDLKLFDWCAKDAFMHAVSTSLKMPRLTPRGPNPDLPARARFRLAV